MKTQTLILNSGKCSHEECYACGWGKLEYPVDMEKAKEKVKNLNLNDTDHLKIFCSGSFLDDKQFTKEFRHWLADYLKEKVKKLTFESRPEYITEENLKPFKKFNLTVSIGLESAFNEVLEKYKKGFTYEDYLSAVETLHKNNFKVRSYLMANMPFSTKEQFQQSVEKVLPVTDELVLINTFPHSKASLFEDWIAGKWMPLTIEEFSEWVKAYKENPKVETDAQNYAFKPKFPKDKMQKIIGATSKNLNHPYFNVWQDYFQRFYKRPEDRHYCLFLPCSFRKPYTLSTTHKKIYGNLRNIKGTRKFHPVVVSNPGVIPLEFSDNYPLNCYDWPEWDETPELMKEYIEVTKRRVKKYLQAQNYEKVFAYMKYTETYDAIKQACEELDIECVNLFSKETYENLKDEKNPIIKKSALKDLRENIQKFI